MLSSAYYGCTSGLGDSDIFDKIETSILIRVINML